MPPRFRSGFVPAALCLALTACSGQSSVPSGTLAPPLGGSLSSSLHAPGAAPAKKSKDYGVGLSTTASVISDKANVSKNHCQSKLDASNNCPQFKAGLKKAKFAYSKSLSGKDGTFSLSQSADSLLGTETYSQTTSASSTDQSDAVEGAGGMESFSWTDTLHVSSTTLPAGTPVTISVSLDVNAGTTVDDCNGGSLTAATLYFEGPGYDALGNGLQISGGCDSSYAFEYVTGDGTQGTNMTGTITTYVGYSVGLSGQGYVQNGVCGSFGGSCVGDFNSALSGSVAWKITGITAGATYTTDSGSKYN